MIWLVAAAVLCTSASQIAQALAARRLPSEAGVLRMLSQPFVWLAYGLLALGLVFWLIALTELELSQTYPLFALGFVLTMLVARFGLGNPVHPRAWLGALLIVTGGVLCNW